MDIVTMVQSVGVPVAFCVSMAWYVKYITDQHREDRNTADQRHRDETRELTKALENNTLAIQLLTAYIKEEDRNDSI